MDAGVVWGLVLLVAALLLFFVEVFIPSGGAIGVVATSVALIAIVLLFNVSRTMGLIGLLAVFISLPLLVALGLTIWPKTPIGRLLTLQARQQRFTAPESEVAPVAEASLVGAVGKADTDLRPVGSCTIEGKRIECLSVAGLIEAGSSVRVVDVSGRQVKVRQES